MDRATTGFRWKPLLWPGMALGVLLAVVAMVASWWRRHPREGQPAPPEMPAGLTEEEAAARWSEGQDNTVNLKPRRTRQQIWYGNICTIFNLNLVGLAIVQLLVARWLDALLSLGTLALNIGLKVGQEMLALRRLAAFQLSAQPKATVTRDAKTRSIDPNRVVAGDVLIVGPGDQFLVDGRVTGPGRMVVDESAVTGKWGLHKMGTGDQVYAGTFCVSGRGAYVAEKVGDERFIVSHMAGTQASGWGEGGRAELTPLERVVDRILRLLLVLLAVLAALLLATFFRLDLGIPPDMIYDAASVIFRIAPSGLFLMIIVTYTTGTADLARRGALVHRARSVESLAGATVICFAEVGILAGTSVEMVPLSRPDVGDADALAESRLRQILGDYARSTSAQNPVTHILANSFEGNRRAIREEAPFLAALGWSAFLFDEQDVQGVYVLGEPQILGSHLVAAGEQAGKGKPRSPAGMVRRLVSPLGRVRKRTAQERVEKTALAAGQVDGVQTPETAEAREPLPRRWAHRIRQTIRGTRRQEEEATEEMAAAPEVVLLFAYHPELRSLHDTQGNVQIPPDLVPLCELRYTRRIRPEAVQVMRGFARAGVSIKVFASDEPDRVLAMLREAGLRQEDEERLLAMGTISGRTLEQLAPAEWQRAALENSLFGGLTPAQAGALVQALRDSGESVAVVGDGVTDLPALQQASLAIARQTGTQAALGVADIVLLGNSPRVLLQVLYRGQAIVHGLLDILKLNLTEVVCLALLIVAIRALSFGFPHVAAQGTAIAVITVAIPSVGLSLWATAGAVSSARLGRMLARFVAPAAVSMSAVTFLVYLYFLGQTGRVAYAQLAVTYTLIYTGLLLVLYLKPPRLSWNSGQRRSRVIKQEDALTRDWRMAGLVLFLGIAAFFLPAIPAAQRHLRLDWLQKPADYGVVGLAVLVWALILSLFWALIPPFDAQDMWPERK